MPGYIESRKYDYFKVVLSDKADYLRVMITDTDFDSDDKLRLYVSKASNHTALHPTKEKHMWQSKNTTGAIDIDNAEAGDYYIAVYADTAKNNKNLHQTHYFRILATTNRIA